MSELFRIQLKVRDYECDLQGLVNNAVYHNYLEHARHEFLLSRGVDFAAMAQRGEFPVVVRAELDYRKPLRPGDGFGVTVRCAMEGKIRMVFQQEIVRDDGVAMLQARFVATVLDARGRPKIPEGLGQRLTD